MDTFNLKKFLTENNLTQASKEWVDVDMPTDRPTGHYRKYITSKEVMYGDHDIKLPSGEVEALFDLNDILNTPDYDYGFDVWVDITVEYDPGEEASYDHPGAGLSIEGIYITSLSVRPTQDTIEGVGRPRAIEAAKEYVKRYYNEIDEALYRALHDELFDEIAYEESPEAQQDRMADERD